MDSGNAPALKVGDRVQLGEGGTHMYVSGLSPNMACCSWVDEDDGVVRQATFHKRRLVLASSTVASLSEDGQGR